MTLSKEQIANYLTHWNTCPYCQSEHIEAEQIHGEDDAVWGVVACLTCGKKWRDVYTLTDIEEITNE